MMSYAMAAEAALDHRQSLEIGHHDESLSRKGVSAVEPYRLDLRQSVRNRPYSRRLRTDCYGLVGTVL